MDRESKSRDGYLPECVCGSLRQVTRAVTQVYDEALRPSGLRAMQFQMLMTLKHLREATISELGALMTMDQTTLTRSLAVLEKQGWVERRARADRRVKAYGLSALGLEVLAVAEPLWAEIQKRVVAHIGDTDWEAVRGPLRALLKLASEHAAGEGG